jgi:hypothetical protein
MIYIYRKQLLLIGLLIAILVAGFIIYKAATPPKQIINKPQMTIIQPSSSAPLSKTSIQQINDNITKLLTTKHGAGAYTAKIRDKTYTHEVTPQGTIIVQVLIDVPQLNETYIYINIGNNNNATAQIYCAPEADQLVHPSVCKELIND